MMNVILHGSPGQLQRAKSRRTGRGVGLTSFFLGYFTMAKPMASAHFTAEGSHSSGRRATVDQSFTRMPCKTKQAKEKLSIHTPDFGCNLKLQSGATATPPVHDRHRSSRDEGARCVSVSEAGHTQRAVLVTSPIPIRAGSHPDRSARHSTARNVAEGCANGK